MTVISSSAHSERRSCIDAIIGVGRLSSGAVLVDGLNSEVHTRAVRHRVCLIPALCPVRPHLTAIENVKLLVTLGGCRPPDRSAAIQALRLSDLPDRFLTSRADTFSGFERLLTWLAVHQLRRTAILLLEDPEDEIPAARIPQFSRLLREACSGDRTVVATSANIEFASRIADDVLTVDQDRLVAHRTDNRSLPELLDTKGSPRG